MAGVEETRAERFQRYQREAGFVLTYLFSRGFTWSPEYEVFVPPASADPAVVVEALTHASFLCGEVYAYGRGEGFSLRELEDLRDTIKRTARRFTKDYAQV